MFTLTNMELTGAGEQTGICRPIELKDPSSIEKIPFTATNEFFNGSFANSSSSSTVMYLDPSVTAANPGSYLTLNISIANVTDLYGWQFKLKWSLGVLRADSEYY